MPMVTVANYYDNLAHTFISDYAKSVYC